MIQWLKDVFTSLFGSKPGTSTKVEPASIVGLTKPAANRPAKKSPAKKSKPKSKSR